MYPVARVMIRRHFVDRSLEADGAYRKRDLRVFRVVGRSTPRALRCLQTEIQLGGRCCIGITTEGVGCPSDASKRILRAVVAFCYDEGLPLFLCGVDELTLAQLFSDDSPMQPNCKVFRSVRDLIALFCEPGFRCQPSGTQRKQARGSGEARSDVGPALD